MEHGIKLGWAVDRQGQARHIREVENGRACDCFCPAKECQKPLIARCNIKNKEYGMQAHFAHEPGSTCTGGALESAIHLAAKRILIEAAGTSARIALPDLVELATAYDNQGQAHKGKASKEINNTLVDAQPEVLLPGVGRRPDVLIVLPADTRIALEIHVRNPKSPDEIRSYEKARFPAMEIDLSRVQWDISYEELRSLVLKSAPRKWLHHPEIKALHTRAQGMAAESAAASNAERQEAAQRRSRQEEGLARVHDSFVHEQKTSLLQWLRAGGTPSMPSLVWPDFMVEPTYQVPAAGRVLGRRVTMQLKRPVVDQVMAYADGRVGSGIAVDAAGILPEMPISICIVRQGSSFSTYPGGTSLVFVIDPRNPRSPISIDWQNRDAISNAWAVEMDKRVDRLREEALAQSQPGSDRWILLLSEKDRAQYLATIFKSATPKVGPRISYWCATEVTWKSILWMRHLKGKEPGHQFTLNELQLSNAVMKSLEYPETLLANKLRREDIHKWLRNMRASGKVEEISHYQDRDDPTYKLLSPADVIPWLY